MSEIDALPYVEVQAKRSSEKVPVQFDWHDYLANKWEPGAQYAMGMRIRPQRLQATGFEYEVTTAGVSGNRSPNFPTVIAVTVRSGSVVFTTRAITDASLRATIAIATFPLVEGLTLSDQSQDDLVHTIYAAGGASGQTYKVINQVVLSNPPGELKESIALLPVQD